MYSEQSITDLVNKNSMRYVDSNDYKDYYLDVSINSTKACLEKTNIRQKKATLFRKKNLLGQI